MPRVTIGVPVYNSEKLLEQCLENLAAQTFKEFKVIVLDNASTDGTRVISQRFVEKDSRFAYVCQSHNKGALQNFIDVLAMADTPYFMWRADDDRSDINFIEELVHLLDRDPFAALAVGNTVLDKKQRRRSKPFPRRKPLEPDVVYRARLLLRSRAQWIYGLFRTNELRLSLERVQARYPHVNAFDYLVLFPFLVSCRVVDSAKTSFVTGFVERISSNAKSGFVDPREMQIVRRDFMRYCERELPRFVIGPMAAAMRPALWIFAERSYRLLKVIHARAWMLLGQKPVSVNKKYN